MRVRFLADANFNQKIVAGLLFREPLLDFALPQETIPERMKDPDVLDLAHSSGRILVSHDVTTIRDAIEDLLLIWHLTEAEEWKNRLEWLPL